MYYVETQWLGEKSWVGPFATPESARRERDHIRAEGRAALVHRSTVAVRAEVAAWHAAQAAALTEGNRPCRTPRA